MKSNAVQFGMAAGDMLKIECTVRADAANAKMVVECTHAHAEPKCRQSSGRQQTSGHVDLPSVRAWRFQQVKRIRALAGPPLFHCSSSAEVKCGAGRVAPVQPPQWVEGGGRRRGGGLCGGGFLAGGGLGDGGLGDGGDGEGGSGEGGSGDGGSGDGGAGEGGGGLGGRGRGGLGDGLWTGSQ